MDSIDFLPEQVSNQRARMRRMARQGYILAACVLGIVALAYLGHGKVSKAQAELSAAQDRAAGAKQQLAVLESLEKQQGELMIMERIENELGSRVGALDVLAELQSLMPESIALSSLTLETMNVALAEPKGRTNRSKRPTRAKDAEADSVNRLRAVITGVSPTDVDVANFIGQLSASPMFEDVNMGYAKTVDFRGRKAREFQASCYITR